MISFFNFSHLEFFDEWLFENLFWACFSFMNFGFLLIFRWSQAQNRFNNSRLFYEEISWYDGQVWEKPLLIIKNDRLVSSQKITPILNRLKRTTYLFSYITFLFFLLITF